MLLVELSPFNKSRLPVYVAYTFSRVPELAVAVPPPAVDGPAVRAGRGVPQTCRGVDNTQPPEAADQRRLRDRRPGGGAALPVLVGAPAQQPAARRDGHRVAAPAATCATACPVAPGVALPEGRPAGAPGPATRDGPKDLDKPPAPTCPSMLPPQAQTRPSTDKARQWQSPAATSLTLTDCRPQVGRSAIVHPLLEVFRPDDCPKLSKPAERTVPAWVQSTIWSPPRAADFIVWSCSSEQAPALHMYLWILAESTLFGKLLTAHQEVCSPGKLRRVLAGWLLVPKGTDLLSQQKTGRNPTLPDKEEGW
eukprot:CAMPEP_0177618446 /NCGR_PEP_ID=MMETSP0419_2-20121207/25579_1 /TAXON_ID=582737 /ORGANISM="Tetraselmis sp., Strain GSL018" /LENGTH=307 /DNA_ID=CAMNT_0019117343 /DNA_START=1946 /DNA_END=2867 /DNA_ORIENTATION=+